MSSILGNVAPPPSPAQRLAETRQLRALTDNRTPELDARATDLSHRGMWSIWHDEAEQYRDHVGFWKGWAGTLRMHAAMGATLLSTQIQKRKHDLDRPYELDPGITPVGKRPIDSSYPSGHSSNAAAAATVLGALWPERKAYYDRVVRDIEWARMYSGFHLPSDIAAGDALGRSVGENFA